MSKPVQLIRTYASFVKFSHTVFALPFALVGMMAAYAVPTEYVFDGSGRSFDEHMPFSLMTVVLILLCMVSARSFAMGVNRIIDRKIDAQNPRTAQREIPAGKMTLAQAWLFVVVMALIYFLSCFVLGDVVAALSPIPIVLMVAYPYMKRITAYCHLVLGASLGLAPVGAWVAVRGPLPDYPPKHQFAFLEPEGFRLILFDWWLPGRIDEGGLGWLAVAEPLPWLLGGAVMFWVAGFDIIYALQDDEFDREHRLHSIPAKFGRKGALWISRAMHVVSAGLLIAFTAMAARLAPWAGTPAWIAAGAMLGGLAFQQSLVRANDLSRVNLAFFTVNGVVSVLFGVVWAAAWL